MFSHLPHKYWHPRKPAPDAHTHTHTLSLSLSLSLALSTNKTQSSKRDFLNPVKKNRYISFLSQTSNPNFQFTAKIRSSSGRKKDTRKA
jgi:hypothetical protein